MRIACRNRIMAFARVIGSIVSDAADFLAGLDLAEQVWQHGGIANIATRHLDRPYLQRLFHADMNLAPETAFGATMLARVPLINRKVMLASPRGGLRPPL